MNLENHVIQPAIVGRSVDLTPPTTMVAAFIGAPSLGVPGALVATPLVGAAKAIYMEAMGKTNREPRSPMRGCSTASSGPFDGARTEERSSLHCDTRVAQIAQSVEQRTRNA